MNKTLREAEAYAAALKAYVATRRLRVNVFIVPPFTALSAVHRIVKDSPIRLAAQNMHWEPAGAWTGEISPIMLRDAGAGMVELGHSERRAAFGETDDTINRKVLAALAHGLRPLICVGETAAERAFGVAHESVARQVKIAVAGVPVPSVRDVLIAYEPVWAIGGAGTPADPDDVNRLHGTIRQALAEAVGEPAAAEVPVLYGGSVNLDNLAGFAAQPLVDGLFIGRAAWDVTSFLACIDAFEAARRSVAPERSVS
jgi:triosephosphate isomerase